MTTTTTITATQTEFIPFGDVVAELNFYSAPADGSSPYNYIGIPPPGMEQSNVGIDPKSITIYDLRGNESKLSLDKEAFSFHTIPSSLTYGDFDNEEKIRSIYYPEIKDIVRKHVSGAKEVIIFDHTIRRSGPNAESTVQRVHIDQTTKSGELRLRRYLTPERVQEVLKKNIRFQIVNIWRPINGAVVSYPLAFADSSTVADDDIVGVAHIYPDYEGQTAGVKYNPIEFWVPAVNQNMRWAAYSCNGFSAGVNPDDFRGSGFQSGYDPVWTDLMAKHYEEPFHMLMGGGDQLYCDGVIREPELQDWIHTEKQRVKKNYQLTDEILFAIDRFYFNHYCQAFRSGVFAKANCRIPMLNMCDDHDLIDGFGSYPDDLQLSPIFRTIGTRGYFFFLLFQCFINVELDGIDDSPGRHPFACTIVGGPGPWVKFPSHTVLSCLGPHHYILMLDCRAERKKDRICSDVEYRKTFERLKQLPRTVEHLVIQLGVPIAYPRMVFLESALESKFNPLVHLGKKGSFGLSGFVNKFNAEAELLDDLNDHWTARGHKKERNLFVSNLQNIAKRQRIRVTFVTGDVHCAAVGVFKTFVPPKKGGAIPPEQDHRYMLDVTTSAIVNTPPPNVVLSMVNTLAPKTHKSMHDQSTDEEMLPLFAQDTDGTPSKGKFIMGRRNWCSIRWDQKTEELSFDIRVEREKGAGETVGYLVKAPAPRWGSLG